MDAEPLFLRRCEQIALLLGSTNEVELLDLGGLLRELLMDELSLLDTANLGRIKTRFHVGAFSAATLEKEISLIALDDDLDPQTSRAGGPTALLTRDQFLKHIVIYANGQPVRVKDVISYAADVTGGIHNDATAQKETLVKFSEHFDLRGLALGLRQLKVIARVTLRSLEPVIENVKKRAHPSAAPSASRAEVCGTSREASQAKTNRLKHLERPEPP